MKQFTSKKELRHSLFVGLLGFMFTGAMAQGYNTTIGPQCNTTNGGTEILNFPTTQMPAGAGTLTLTYNGDLDLSTEYLEFFGEGSQLLGQSPQVSGQCSGTGTSTFSIPQATLAAWISSGMVVSITVNASSAVSGGTCGFCVTGTLTYNVITGPNDAGVLSVDSPSVFCAGVENVVATIANTGTNNLDSVEVNWSINGVVQTPVMFNQTLYPFGVSTPNTASVVLGSHNFTAPTNIVVWTSNPNGVNDTINNNDTAYYTAGPALGGIYTVGGVNPDYTDFTAAVNALHNYGVCSPVTFHVRGGTYNEQIIIGAITGISSVNDVTFMPDPANSAPVTLTFSPSSSTSNYTVRFDNTSYINFSNIEIATGGGTYSHVLEYMNTNHVTIDSCTITGSPSGTTSNNSAVVYNYSGTTDMSNYNTFSNSTIQDGSYGFYWYGGSSSIHEVGNSFINNVIDGFYYMGIASYYQDSTTIQQNTISNSGAYSSSYGMYIYYNANFDVSRNNIEHTSSSSGYGVYIYYANQNALSVNPAVFSNNFISVNGSSNGNPYGLRTYNPQNLDIVFNNILMNTGSNGAYPLEGYSSSTTYGGNRILNNSIASAAGSPAIYLSGTGATSGAYQTDYNNYYTTGTILGDYNGATALDLSGWQSLTSDDANSVSMDPIYMSNTDLHVMNTGLNAQATPITGITVDYDNATRDPSTPDIGADEFVPPALDAGIMSIDTPATFTCVFGPVWATLFNFGLNTIDTVTLNWSVNGTPMTPVNFTSLNLANTEDTMLYVGSTTLNPGDVVSVWTTLPNNQFENPSEAWNDTLTRTLNPGGLNGTYTLGGGSGADYYSYNAVISDLANYGVCGPVIINVNDSTYNEVLTLDPIPGMDATNTVTFRSLSGDSSMSILTNSGSSSVNHTVGFYGGSHFIFEGITIENTNLSYPTAIRFYGGSDNVTFKNCVITAPSQSSTSTTRVLIYAYSGSVDNNISFINNVMEGGSYTMYWYGGSTSAKNENTLIEGNIITPGYYRGIYTLYSDGLKIRNNTMYATSGLTSSAFYWIYLSYASGFEITGNMIGGDVGSYAYGMYFTNSGGTASNHALVANNFTSYGDPSSVAYFYGYYVTGSGNIDFLHNNFYAESNDASNRAFYLSSGSGIRMLNNNIVSMTPGYGIYLLNDFILEESDYNNIYVPGGNAGFNGGAATNLAAWQNVSGMDANSFSVDPLYASLTDLHVCNDTLENAGTFVGITTDYDGDGRMPSMVDIGADEFVAFGPDFPDTSFCVGGSVEIGAPGVTGVQYNWITGATTPTITVTIPGTYMLQTLSACGSGQDTVIVTEDPLPVASFSPVQSYLTYTFNNTSLNSNSWLWDFGDGTTSTDQHPVHVFGNSGYHTVTLYATNDCGTDSVTLEILIEITSAPEIEDESGISVYPNPTKELVNLVMEGVNAGQYVLTLTDLGGRTIAVTQLELSHGTVRHPVDLAGLASGTYLLQVSGGDLTRTFRIVKE